MTATARAAGLLAAFILAIPSATAQEQTMKLDPDWEFVADTVMGGASRGKLEQITRNKAVFTRLTGDVSLENNGGFVQMAFDVKADGSSFDASDWTGLEFQVLGNAQAYDLRLRTSQLERPWQSFRTSFFASQTVQTLQIPFSDLQAHRTEDEFDPSKLRRIGILAIGREFTADVAIADLRFYR